MSPDDLPRFAVLMGTLESAYRVRFGQDTIEVYWRGLQSLPWHEVTSAVGKAIETSVRLPTVAALRALVSTGRVDANKQGRSGTYPPDIAARRRQLGLPVTPAEHVAYDQGEMREPPYTAESMVEILRDVAARDATGEFSAGRGSGRVAWMAEMADQIEQRVPLERTGNVFADAFVRIAERVIERQPGEDDDGIPF